MEIIDYQKFKKFMNEELKTIDVSRCLFFKEFNYFHDEYNFGGIFRYRNKLLVFQLLNQHNGNKVIRIYPVVFVHNEYYSRIYSRCIDLLYEPGLFIGTTLPKANTFNIGDTVLANKLGRKILCKIKELSCTGFRIMYYLEPIENVNNSKDLRFHNTFISYESKIKLLNNGI